MPRRRRSSDLGPGRIRKSAASKPSAARPAFAVRSLALPPGSEFAISIVRALARDLQTARAEALDRPALLVAQHGRIDEEPRPAGAGAARAVERELHLDRRAADRARGAIQDRERLA